MLGRHHEFRFLYSLFENCLLQEERFMIPIDFETHDLRNLGFSIRFISSSGEIGTATISSRFNGQMGAKQGRSYRVR